MKCIQILFDLKQMINACFFQWWYAGWLTSNRVYGPRPFHDRSPTKTSIHFASLNPRSQVCTMFSMNTNISTLSILVQPGFCHSAVAD